MLNLDTTILLLLIALIVALFTRLSRRPYSIALVIWGLILGLLSIIEPIHLTKELVLALFLPPLLFEGALHIRAEILRPRMGLVLGLALAGTLLTAFIIGAAVHFLLGFDWLTGLLLGAILAPTDPISVMAIFRAARIDRELSTIIESESLFNDGIAVVLYVMLLGALNGGGVDPVAGIGNFALVIGAGAGLGLGLGMLVSRLMKRIDDHLVEVMATLVLIYGTYLLAEHLHLSGVIAVALAGLAVSNFGLRKTSAASRRSIGLFWEIVTFLINSVVFLLIGFELRPSYLVSSFPTILLVFAVLLASRALMVYGLGAFINWKQHNLPLGWQHLIVWGGLRGAVPVALALGLPANLPGHSELINIIFGVVLLSLLGQGLTMPSVIRRLNLELKKLAPEEVRKGTYQEVHGEVGQEWHVDVDKNDSMESEMSETS